MSERITEVMHAFFCTKSHKPDEEFGGDCRWYEEMVMMPIPWDGEEHLKWLKETEDQLKLDGINEMTALEIVNTFTKLDFTKCTVRKLAKRFLDTYNN